MKLEIEKPAWTPNPDEVYGALQVLTLTDFNKWFTENVEPINKLLREGVEVYYNYSYSNDIGAREYFWHESHVPSDEKKALLINITETKPKTRVEKLEECLENMLNMNIIMNSDDGIVQSSKYDSIIGQAKALLGQE